jgi:hypothetical protein
MSVRAWVRVSEIIVIVIVVCHCHLSIVNCPPLTRTLQNKSCWKHFCSVKQSRTLSSLMPFLVKIKTIRKAACTTYNSIHLNVVSKRKDKKQVCQIVFEFLKTFVYLPNSHRKHVIFSLNVFDLRFLFQFLVLLGASQAVF